MKSLKFIIVMMLAQFAYQAASGQNKNQNGKAGKTRD